MIWWALGIYLIIFIFVLPIKLQTKVFFNLFENYGSLDVFLWGKNILKENCKINGKTLILQNKDKMSFVDINKFGENNFVDRFFFSLVKMLKVNTIKSDIVLGIEGDSFYSNIFAGCLLSFQSALLAVISTKKKIKILRATVVQTNLENDFCINLSFSISLCLLQVVISLVCAMINFQKGVKYGKQSN